MGWPTTGHSFFRRRHEHPKPGRTVGRGQPPESHPRRAAATPRRSKRAGGGRGKKTAPGGLESLEGLDGQQWTNSLGMKFAPVPGTKVAFCIWETQVRDYAAFAEAMDADVSWKNPRFPQTPDEPVVNVSWYDAKAFCLWLTAKERTAGLIGKDIEYRLPTDEEWSVAVGLPEEKGRTPMEKHCKIDGVYPWGTEWPPPKGAGNYGQDLGVDDFESTSPVGSFAANPFGLYDMGGNVWEWCADWYDGEQKLRVLRGGSWNYCFGRDYYLSSCRNCGNPYVRFYYDGFRCVLVVSGG